MYNQTNEFVYLGGNVNHNTDLSIEVDRRIRSARCSFGKYALELYDRPSTSPRAQNPDAKSRGTRDNAVRLRHVDPARMPLRHVAPNPPKQVLDSLHRLAKAQSRRLPDFLSGHAFIKKTGRESIDFTQEADLDRGICDAHGGYETAEVRDIRRTGWGSGLCGGPGKRVDGVFPGRPQSFWHQRRPVDDCSSAGRGGMAQNGGTRGGTFHGEMDRCRRSQGWTMACGRMFERDGKDQGEDIYPKARGLVLVCSPLLTSHKDKWRELLSSGRLVCRCHDVFL